MNRSKDVNYFNTFSSLAGLISQHTESTNSDTTKISSQSDTNVAQSFSSLAALTADYLQKSNTNNIESRERQSLKTQFVIPKLSIKKENSEETKNLPSPKFHNENSKKQLISTNTLSKHEINLLQKDFSNINIVPKSNTVRDIKSEEQLKNPISVVNETCSPCDDLVDLSTALKEAEFLADNAFCNANLTNSRQLYNNTHNLEICFEDDNRITPNALPVTLNLCALRYVKLPYTKKNVSIFGKTLCKKREMKRPVLKAIVRRYNMIKPFDFSIPYQNSNRSYQ